MSGRRSTDEAMVKDHKLGNALICAVASLCMLAASAGDSASQQDLATQGNAAPHRPRIGLVLGGGGARGAAHIGVIKVLEELHVPVDYIAGTSMGSIVGGAYAAGKSPAEMEDKLRKADWKRLLSDRLRREDRSIYEKQLERENILGLQIGYRDGKLLLPRGVVIGSQLELFFGGMVDLYHGPFDDLAIPFRAVATDIVTGEMVVLDRGSLVGAMRGSMSVPGVFAPYPLDDRLLVDGMVVRNLPVDVVRAMGAEVVIAVNVGSTLQPREKIRDALSVTGQMVSILTEQNVQASLKELGPDDILVDVQAELGDFATGDFAKAVAAIPYGQAAARKIADKLSRYSLSAEQFAAHRAQQLANYRVAKPDKTRLDTAGLKYVNPKSVQVTVGTDSDGMATAGQARLDSGLKALAATEDFEKFDYRYEDLAGERVLVVKPIEKDWGPNYLRFGMDLATDFKGQSSFDVLVNHRMTWLNASGLEWRNRVSLGRTTALNSELYQPLDYERNFFVAPTLEFLRQRNDLYVDEDPVSTYLVQGSFAGVDLGANLGTAAQLRLGYVAGREKASPEVSLPVFNSVEQRVGGLRAVATYDTFDNWAFPRAGLHAYAHAFYAREGLGSDTDWETVEGQIDKALAAGRHRLQIGLAGGSSLDTGPPVFNAFALGGFLRLSGYGYQQFLGQEYAFGRAIYTYALGQSQLIDSAVYVGGSLEAGNVYQRINGPSSTGVKPGGSLFVAVDTIAGPAYFAVGAGESGNYAVYIFLGAPR
jgi:NTE family protein